MTPAEYEWQCEEEDKLAKEMWLEATQHGDRYLLPTRYRAGVDPKKDRLYKTANHLVNDGYARWITAPSTFGPGIELTSKPGPR